jgi:hypothetical protein
MAQVGLNACSRHAMRAVAAGNEIALQFDLSSFVFEANDWRRSHVAELHAFDPEEDGPALSEPCADQILQNFVLRIDGDGAAARQLMKIDPVRLAVETKLDAVMDEALALQAIGNAEL